MWGQLFKTDPVNNTADYMLGDSRESKYMYERYIVGVIIGVISLIIYPQMWIRPALISKEVISWLIVKRHSAVMSEMRGEGRPTGIDGSGVKLLNQIEAGRIDEELFNEYKFSVDQLMELAGLSVATAVATVYSEKKLEKVLIVTGPGNNGGDGLVVARHLKLFGFENVSILNARKPTKELYINLLHQAAMNDVEFLEKASAVKDPLGLVVDALFGFSFKPPVRPEFQPLVDIMVNAAANSVPVVAVDIPSGWDVEKGPPQDSSVRFMPEMLVSLTAPKMCAKYFTGPYHFIGGRFVPKRLADKYALNLPQYPGTECVLRIK